MSAIIDAEDRVEPPEDSIHGGVLTSTILPALNHSLVVTMDNKVPASQAKLFPVSYKTDSKEQEIFYNLEPVQMIFILYFGRIFFLST